MAERILARTWWAWSDQGKYHQDVLAWASGNLDPSQHYYFPGYGLIAAPFVHLTPLNPFAIPDFVCILATTILVALIGQKLLPDRRWMPAFAAWAFFATLAIREDALKVWLDPWNTTPTVPLCLWALLAALRFGEMPTGLRAAAAGFSAVIICAFRPTEALIYGFCSSVFCSTYLANLRFRTAAALSLCAALGALAGLTPCAIAYLLTHGPHQSDYVIISHQIGFDIRLLPFQWVTIMLSPGPILAATPSIIPVYPWFALGVAGVFLGVANTDNWRLRCANILVGGAAITNLLVFLCYRDLHSVGLFRYGNQHYFKGVSAILVIFTVILADGLIRSRQSRIVACLALTSVVATLPWRAQLKLDSRNIPSNNGQIIKLPEGFKGISYTLNVKTMVHAVDYGHIGAVLKIAGKTLQPIIDYRLVPTPAGFLVQAVREPPMGPAELDLPSDIQLDPARTGALAAGWITYCLAGICKPPP
jgi:hypothetical protein